MAKQFSKRGLLKEMTRYFPDRWEVARLKGKADGERVAGTIKIHCLEDDRNFLSDFDATLDQKGKIVEFTLDGVTVGKFVGRLHRAD